MELPLLRRLFHFLGIVVPITYLLLGRGPALALAATILVLLAAVDILRLTTSFDSPFLRKHLKEKEMKKPTASLFYMASCLLVILFFDKPTAVASILVLAIADPLSAIVGKKWGGRRFLGKSVEGTAVFFLSSFFILGCFPFRAAALVAAVAAATAAEFFSSRFVDDNLSIPLACALALTIFAR